MSVKDSKGRIAFSRETSEANTLSEPGRITLDVNKRVDSLTYFVTDGIPKTVEPKGVKELLFTDSTVYSIIPKGTYSATIKTTKYSEVGEELFELNDNPPSFGLLSESTPRKSFQNGTGVININMGDSRAVGFNSYQVNSVLDNFDSEATAMDISSDGLNIATARMNISNNDTWSIHLRLYRRSSLSHNWTQVGSVTSPNYSTSPYTQPVQLLDLNIIENLTYVGGETDSWINILVNTIHKDSSQNHNSTVVHFAVKKSNNLFESARLLGVPAPNQTANTLYLTTSVNGSLFHVAVSPQHNTFKSGSYTVRILGSKPYLARYDGSGNIRTGTVPLFGTSTVNTVNSPKELNFSRSGSVLAVSNNDSELVLGVNEDVHAVSTVHVNQNTNYTSGRYLSQTGFYIDGSKVAEIEVYDQKGNISRLDYISRVFFASPNGYCSGFCLVNANNQFYHAYFYLTDSGVVKVVIIDVAHNLNERWCFKGTTGSLTDSIVGMLAVVNWNNINIRTYRFGG